ncbi:MAG: hypothetical protein ACO2OS_03145 [Thermosphaera aggregans]|jgi:hypothetical protein|uniref:hypothetical protein n=1 Tax=Thermosphaera aggregans TaxID=54254 RepID=UPI003C031766
MGQRYDIHINEFNVKAGENGRIVFSRIRFYEEYTVAVGLAIGPRDAEPLDEEVLKNNTSPYRLPAHGQCFQTNVAVQPVSAVRSLLGNNA